MPAQHGVSSLNVQALYIERQSKIMDLPCSRAVEYGMWNIQDPPIPYIIRTIGMYVGSGLWALGVVGWNWVREGVWEMLFGGHRVLVTSS